MIIRKPECTSNDTERTVHVQSAATALLIAVLGIVCLGWATDNFRAVLLETARRLEITETHPTLPDVLAEDQFGNVMNIADLRGGDLVATFMYTHCMTLCSVTGSDLAWLQYHHATAQLLSVSFDERDDRAALQDYARRHRSQWPGWRVVRIPDPAARKRFLRQLGVVVIPDGLGGYTHNAALYLIDPDGRVRSVFDIDDASLVLATLESRP